MHNGENFKGADLDEAERRMGYRFRDRALLETCLTHKSYSNVFGMESNERLEFLGDAVLELIVTEQLFRMYDSDEGRLTELRQQYVSQQALEAACERAGLKEFLRYSGGESNVGGKTASNLFEAVLGGIYLDGGMARAREFLNKYLALSGAENYKSLLQEYVQGRSKRTPVYEVTEREGGYECTAHALGKQAKGAGASKKAAETEAAARLLRILESGE